MHRGEIQYAKAGEHHIAFREYLGDAGGDHEIVMVSGANWPMDSFVEDPVMSRLLEGLAGLGRLITFDRRGIALSDPITDWETPLYEQWADDLAAVIGTAGCDPATVFSWNHAATAECCSVRFPDLVDRLILFNPGSPLTEADESWMQRWIASWRRIQAGEPPQDGEQAHPGRAADPAFRAWNDDAGRMGASPSLSARIGEKTGTDPPFDRSQVVVPTLVVTRSPSNWVIPQEFFHRAARLIPGAQHVDLGSGDAAVFGLGVDDLLVEISRFITGEVRLPPPERQVTVVMFTDLVESTRLAAAAGDESWKRVLDEHDEITRDEVARRGGEVVKTTGDGVLALLPSATAAVQAAGGVRDRLADDGLDVRIGLHLGEVDRRGGDVSGLAVNVAARVMGLAGAGEILATEVVKMIGNAEDFDAAGERELAGVEGMWRLYVAQPCDTRQGEPSG